jgi:mitochondrial distribution and morphology protein 10
VSARTHRHPRQPPQKTLPPDYLLYGRLYVPTGRLDALYSTRLSSTLQALVAAISDPRADLKQSQSTRTASSPSNIMFNLQHDTGRWCTEYTYSAEDSMLGVRLLHNFGKLAPTSPPSGSALDEADRSAISRAGSAGGTKTKMKKRIDEEDAMEGGLKGRISTGAEIYFSAKEKSAGGL